MCQAMQRKRFFTTLSTSERSLPTTWEPDVRLLPGRSKSISGRLSHRGGGPETPVMAPYSTGTMRQQPRHFNPGSTFVWVIGCLLLAPLMGALVYQRQADLGSMEQIREDIAHHIQQLKELKDFTQAGLGKISLYGDLDTDRHVFFLEENRIKTHQNIQLLSQRLLREKFGLGPKYRVEMRLIFDPTTNPEIVVLETASIEIMPHAVFHFLELVSHGAYDGTPFHTNANHILQAGPSVVQQSLTQNPSLSKVLFQEYSPEMPHTKYSLGFAGRPGGPDFYINMRDNSQLHGPGGQAWHYGDVADEADPCFATVIDGLDVIDRIRNSNPKGYGQKMIQPVLIHEMIIQEEGMVEREVAPNTRPLRSNKKRS